MWGWREQAIHFLDDNPAGGRIGDRGIVHALVRQEGDAVKVNFGWQMLVVLLVAGAAIYFYFKGKRAVSTLVTETLNPASDRNIVNTGVNKVVQSITGNKDATLGGSIYDAIHDTCGNFKFPWQDSKCDNVAYNTGKVPVKSVVNRTYPASLCHVWNI